MHHPSGQPKQARRGQDVLLVAVASVLDGAHGGARRRCDAATIIPEKQGVELSSTPSCPVHSVVSSEEDRESKRSSTTSAESQSHRALTTSGVPQSVMCPRRAASLIALSGVAAVHPHPLTTCEKSAATAHSTLHTHHFAAHSDIKYTSTSGAVVYLVMTPNISTGKDDFHPNGG